MINLRSSTGVSFMLLVTFRRRARSMSFMDLLCNSSQLYVGDVRSAAPHVVGDSAATLNREVLPPEQLHKSELPGWCDRHVVEEHFSHSRLFQASALALMPVSTFGACLHTIFAWHTVQYTAASTT